MPIGSGEQLVDGDIDMAEASSSSSSSSDDSSGGEDAVTSRQFKQPRRPTASSLARRWFPTFWPSSNQSTMSHQPSTFKSRKRKNSETGGKI